MVAALAQGAVGRDDLPLQRLEVHPLLGPDEDARLERLEVHELTGKRDRHEDEVVRPLSHQRRALLGQHPDDPKLPPL